MTPAAVAILWEFLLPGRGFVLQITLSHTAFAAPPGSAVAYLRMGHLWLKPPGPNLPVVAVAAYFPKVPVICLCYWC